MPNFIWELNILDFIAIFISLASLIVTILIAMGIIHHSKKAVQNLEKLNTNMSIHNEKILGVLKSMNRN